MTVCTTALLFFEGVCTAGLVDVELVDVELAGLLGAPEGVDSTEEEEALERG